MTHPGEHPEFAALLGELLDGELDDAQERRLAELASADPALMERYLDATELHAVLRWEMQWACPPFRGHADAAPPRHGRLRLRMLVRYAAAAVVVLAFTTAISVLISFSRPHQQARARPMLATLIDADHAEWAPGDLPTRIGDRLGGGFLYLRSGTATVEFVSGARVTLTGSCDFGLNSPMRGELRRGRLVAYVPDRAHGFTIAAPGLAVVDLGTAFTLDVESDTSTDLHVLRGAVEVHRTNAGHDMGEPRRLTAHHTMLVRGAKATVLDHAAAPSFAALAGLRTLKIDADPVSGWVSADGSISRDTHAARVGIAGSVSAHKRCGMAAVLVFALPRLDPEVGGPTDADLDLMLTRVIHTGDGPRYGVDLYLLGGRDTPGLKVADYFAGSASESRAGAVLIQRGLLTPQTPAGRVRLSDAGRAMLRSRLREMYGPDGRPRHPFLVLRLNPDAPLPRSGTGLKEGYEITGIGGAPGYTPRLGLRTADLSTIP